MTNKIIATAAGISLALTFVHIGPGGSDVHAPLLASDLPDILKGYISVIWHGVTAIMLINSALLATAAIKPELRWTLSGIVILQYIGFVALFLFYGLARFGSVTQMPPWIGFLVIIAVAGAGLWADPRQTRQIDAV